MIKYLLLKHLGPADSMEFSFGPRYNALTGDNGLGKTFMLDILWWAMTRTWATRPIHPLLPVQAPPNIQFGTYEQKRDYLPKSLNKQNRHSVFNDRYDIEKQKWTHSTKAPPYNGIAIYARVDGGICVWDPAKAMGGNTKRNTINKTSAAFHFSPEEIWEGKRQGKIPVCNGLYQDWITWQFKGSSEFSQLEEVLSALSPGENETMRVTKPERLSVSDSREFPCIILPYGRVPLPLASAGMRRVISLAYAMIWAVSENKLVSEKLQVPPAEDLVFLIDEVESHLHPQWQRVILPAIYKVCNMLMASDAPKIQVIATTHAPLVLASLEPHFDEELDNILVLESEKGRVRVNDLGWAKQGDTVGWLVSDSFGLTQARSKEAEIAIEAAMAYMRNDKDSLPDRLQDQEAIHRELLRVLPGHDPFWPRWIMKRENA